MNAARCQYTGFCAFAKFPYSVDALHARLLINIISKDLCLRANSYTVSNLLDPHLLQHLLVHVHQVLAIDVVSPEDFHILPAIDAPQPVSHPSLVPVLHRLGCIISIGLREFGFCGRGEEVVVVGVDSVGG